MLLDDFSIKTFENNIKIKDYKRVYIVIRGNKLKNDNTETKLNSFFHQKILDKNYHANTYLLVYKNKDN